MPDEDEPTTQELRAVQREREASERDALEEAPTEEAQRAHARRADKASYLASKLAEAERSEERESE
jgi:hypothetical protein